jgi:RNA polymerase sigma factor (sigma-70 family)
MKDYSDEDLLFMTSFQKESEKDAQEAFTIFYHRYKQFLWNMCLSICQDDSLAKDVTQNTWIAIYKSGHTYNASESKVKTWMSTIAQNEFKDLMKSEVGYKSLNEDIDSIADSDSENNDEEEMSIPSPEKKSLDEALNQLSEKEKDILLTYFRFSDGNRHLPDEVLLELRQKYNTTSENLRQIRKRSFVKIKSKIFKSIQ